MTNHRRSDNPILRQATQIANQSTWAVDTCEPNPDDCRRDNGAITLRILARNLQSAIASADTERLTELYQIHGNCDYTTALHIVRSHPELIQPTVND